MLTSSLERLPDQVGEADVVLDIGGWARPLSRADWVMDLRSYESRGQYGGQGPGPERFGPDTWVRRDICDRDPYPFADKSIDFVVCSHTLEDVRDPVWVCSEINRIAKAGYIEVPSRLEEQTWGVQGPWVGWGHHHWLIDVTDQRIRFVFKPHILHGRPEAYFPRALHSALSEEERVQTLWWNGAFDYAEQIMTGREDLDPYLADFVSANRRRVRSARRLGVLRRLGRRASRLARRRAAPTTS